MKMEVAFAFFAEAAQITSDGKLNVLGVDLRNFSGRFPYTLPLIAFVAKIVFEPAEREGMHRFVAQMIGPDGSAIEPRIEGEYVAPPPVNPALQAAFTVVFQILGMI